MNKMLIRKENLRKLVEEYGGIELFVKARSRDDSQKQINASYVSQLLNGKRNFGERAARNMEDRAGLPEGFFDECEDDKKDTIKDDHNLYHVLGIDPNELTIEQIEYLRLSLKIPIKKLPQAKKIAATFIDRTTNKKRSNEKDS